MRIGGSVEKPYHSPQEWLGYVQELNYSAVVFPVDSSAPVDLRREYLQCARDHDLLIGEVGIWRNCFASDPKAREEAIAYSMRQLELAEDVGARCCVNISGSCSELWDAYHPDNYLPETYDLIVETTQKIIDAVQPKHTFFTLEPMPWMYPDSPEQYLQLMKDVDRKAFAVHLDFANMINSLERYHNSSEFITHCFELLGANIRSIHAKDVLLAAEKLPLCIEEIMPGQGSIDFKLVLRLAHQLGDDTPVFVEHLKGHEEYMQASSYIRNMALAAGVPVK